MMCRFLPSLALVGLMGMLAPAQEQREEGSGSKKPQVKRDQMSEDIEVMRRLLLRKIRAVPRADSFGFAFRTDGNPSVGLEFDWDGPGAHVGQLAGELAGRGGYGNFFSPGGFTAEGAYLRGYGIVYSITMPFLPREANTKPGRTSRAVSEWEEVQRQVRGEKTARKSGGEPSAGLTDTLLKTVAENGKHLSELKPDENLAIIVTFRGPRSFTGSWATGLEGIKALQNWNWSGPGSGGQGGFAPRGGAGGAGGGGLGRPGGGIGAGTAGGPGAAGGGGSSPGGGGGFGGFRGQPTSAHDYELLADLLLKQDKAGEAADALKKALDLDSAVSAQLRIYHKLAQAYLASDQEGEAQKALKKLSDLRKKSPAAKGSATTTTSGSAAVAVPAQLIITVPKSLLDRVGQISVDEFRQGATIERRDGPKQ